MEKSSSLVIVEVLLSTHTYIQRYIHTYDDGLAFNYSFNITPFLNFQEIKFPLDNNNPCGFIDHPPNFFCMYVQGVNGLFKPKVQTILDCRDKKTCRQFQEERLKCNAAVKHHCLFAIEYADKSLFKGVIVNDSVTLELNDQSTLQTNLAFGYVIIHLHQNSCNEKEFYDSPKHRPPLKVLETSCAI